MDVFRSAYVYVRNVFAGVLSETDSGYMFVYDKNYMKSESASAVSLTLPIIPKFYFRSLTGSYLKAGFSV